MADTQLKIISQISKNIYLSGIFPLANDVTALKLKNIKYILCCVGKQYVFDIHERIIMQYPDTVILYLPYDDIIDQDLWAQNNNMVDITVYTKSISDYDRVNNLLTLYKNKPLIEIGYHFINDAINDSNVLVHCMAGVSRSVSVVIYFFMKKYNMDFDATLGIIKSFRQIACPNISFQEQLRTYGMLRDRYSSDNTNKIIKAIDIGIKRNANV